MHGQQNIKTAEKFDGDRYLVNQSLYRPEVPRGFDEVQVPRLCDNGPEWW